MRTLLPLLLLLPMLAFGNALWGKKGHRVTGHLAEKHLSGKAKRAIKKLLDGHSLAYVSTYADEIKAERKYSAYNPWHYVNYPLGATYADAEKSKYGDVVAAIDRCIAVLVDKQSSRADKIFNLKLLVHFVGDLHQPLHAGIAADKGGNDIQVRWFNEGSNLHRVWDTNMLESYGMSAVELAQELDRSTTKQQRKQMQKGTVAFWADESHTLAAEVYGSAKVGQKLSYGYGYKYNAVMFDCLKKGGYRLARVLNEVFG